MVRIRLQKRGRQGSSVLINRNPGVGKIFTRYQRLSPGERSEPVLKIGDDSWLVVERL